MRTKLLGGALLAGLALQPASASLILETFQQFSGTGLGAVPTIVTFQASGSETGCVGSGGGTGMALVAGTCTSGGNTGNGASQAQLQPLTAGGITATGAAGAGQFALVFNAVQPAGGPLAVTNITAAFYSSTGAFLYQTSGLLCQTSPGATPTPAGPGGCVLPTTGQGTGNSGYLVVLDSSQQSAAVMANAFSSTSNLVGVSAAAGTSAFPSAGGSETVFIANSGTVVPTAIPEPGTYALIALGLGVVSLGRKYRRA